MLRRGLIYVFLIAVLAMQGCATLPSPEKMALEVEEFTLPVKEEDGSALVYVVRPSSLGGLIRFNVFLDDKEAESEMGYTRGSQYIYFHVSPGPHQISSKAENWADVTIDAKSDELIFIKQDTQMGFIMARNQISQIDIVEGKYHVKHTKLGTIIKIRK